MSLQQRTKLRAFARRWRRRPTFVWDDATPPIMFGLGRSHMTEHGVFTKEYGELLYRSTGGDLLPLGFTYTVRYEL